MQDKIYKEILAGQVAGSFLKCPIDFLRISPIGLVPKRTLGMQRLIHHLSYSLGISLNDFIDPDICSVQYTGFDEAVLMMQDFGTNCKLFKMDLKNAFRLMTVNRKDFELLGFKFNGKYYIVKLFLLTAQKVVGPLRGLLHF